MCTCVCVACACVYIVCVHMCLWCTCTSRRVVVSHEAKKKQHAHTSSGLRDHYSQYTIHMYVYVHMPTYNCFTCSYVVSLLQYGLICVFHIYQTIQRNISCLELIKPTTADYIHRSIIVPVGTEHVHGI